LNAGAVFGVREEMMEERNITAEGRQLKIDMLRHLG